MKILIATMGLDIGGAETHIVELAKELKHQGHDIAIVSNGGVYVPEITAAGIRHYDAPLHRRSLRDMRIARAILAQIIRQEAPDVVHAHARIPAFLCGTLKRRLKFPFVTTAHWVFNTKGILRYLTNWGERTVAVSEDIREYLIREYKLPPEHISVTINGIDTEKFSPQVSGAEVIAEFGLDPDKPIVSYVSRMDEDRALVARQLIEIAPRLDEAAPGVQLLIAGGGNVFDELNAKAEAANAALGRRCVVMTGARTDINRIAAAGQIFVGVSRSALEAMSAGKPVIVAGNEGYHGLFGPDKLAEAQAGNFCCRGLPLSQPERLLADVSAALAMSAAEREELGRYGRQVIFDHYSVNRMARDCLAMYDQVRRRKHRVLVSGYYGFSNAGDDAILEAIRQSVQGEDIGVTVLSNAPALTWKQYGMDAVPRFRMGRVFAALRRCDALLSGGGSLLQDTTSTRSLVYYLSVIRCAQWLGKPVMLYANGIGPVRRPANRRRVRKAVERAALVTLRDHSSARELAAMGVKRQDLHVTADPVFHLSPAAPERGRELAAQAGLPDGKPFAVVSVREWPNTGAFSRELARLCDHLRRTYGLEILFLLMQPAVDREAAEQVRCLMTEPSRLLDASCSPRELMAVLGQARLCLAMRLHTLIFAARMAVPTMGLVYDPKVASYLQELELPSAGEVERFDGDEAIRRTDRLMADYDSVLAGLRRKSDALTRAAGDNEKLLLELLNRGAR
ncbi:MAG: polysaccharide pyruvyl transferase CsaB [Oscillospiraceae bacterium]|jgi:polysaccharide pyruvyl transferase CsaB|nr:polysaccharide pyruvyl transferase CsaB [Oscillospiraceae bacterium]